MIGASYLFRKCGPAASGEAIYVKMIVKKPGLTIAKEMSEMDLVSDIDLMSEMDLVSDTDLMSEMDLVSNSGEYSSADCGC